MGDPSKDAVPTAGPRSPDDTPVTSDATPRPPADPAEAPVPANDEGSNFNNDFDRSQPAKP